MNPFARNSTSPFSGATTSARMICGMTTIGTRAVATSSDRASAEIKSPIAVPAIASAASATHCEAADPGGWHHARTMTNSSVAWNTPIRARTSELRGEVAADAEVEIPLAEEDQPLLHQLLRRRVAPEPETGDGQQQQQVQRLLHASVRLAHVVEIAEHEPEQEGNQQALPEHRQQRLTVAPPDRHVPPDQAPRPGECLRSRARTAWTAAAVPSSRRIRRHPVDDIAPEIRAGSESLVPLLAVPLASFR